MYTVLMMVTNQAQMLQLQFTALERAQKAYDVLMADGWESREVTDDYGRKLRVDRAKIDMCMLSDVEKAGVGDRAIQLLGARSQASLQKAIAADPAIKQFAAMQQGMPMMGRG